MTISQLAFCLVTRTLILGFLLFMVPPALSSESICDLETQYPIRNDSKIADCRDCGNCGKGREPVIPCGTVIDNNQSVGPCRACRNGTFSPKKDQKPCRICQKPKCLDHEIVLQNCTDTFDDSRCSGICDSSFVMNKEKTECIKLYKPQQEITTTFQPQLETTTVQLQQKSTIATQYTTNQPQHNSTKQIPTSASNESSEKDTLSSVEIIFTTIGSLVFVVAVIALCWHLCKKYEVDSTANKSCNGSPSTSTELLDMETGKLIKQASELRCFKQCNIDTGADASATDTPSNGQVAFEMQVTPTESVMSTPLKSPFSAPPFHQPEMMTVRAVTEGTGHPTPPGPHRVVGLEMNAETYDTICILLSDEMVNNNWKMLAGRMDFDIGKVKKFATTAKWQNKYPADVLLDHWSKLSCKNDVANLKELAGQIERDDIVQLLEH